NRSASHSRAGSCRLRTGYSCWRPPRASLPESSARASCPSSFPTLARFEFFREFLFRTVSQVTINYRNCALNEGRAGDVHGGDRLPWVMVERLDNYDSLNAMVWQVHVYGVAKGAVRSWCRQHGLPLHEFAWRPQYGEAGFAQDALYLIRPDSYVALADQSNSADVLQRYFAQRGIRIEQGGARQDARRQD